jgi:hypothetical protein
MGEMEQETKHEIFAILDKLVDFDRQIQLWRQDIEELEEKMELIRAKYLVEIGTALDIKKRRLYASDKLRDAALTLKLAEDNEYQKLDEEVWEFWRKIHDVGIEERKLNSRKDVLMTAIGAKEFPPGILLTIGVNLLVDYVTRSPYQERRINITQLAWEAIEQKPAWWWAQILLALEQHFACDVTRALSVLGEDSKAITHISQVYPQELDTLSWHISTVHFPTGFGEQDKGTTITYPLDKLNIAEANIVIRSYVVKEDEPYWNVDIMVFFMDMIEEMLGIEENKED